jgi:hypothetical protein
MLKVGLFVINVVGLAFGADWLADWYDVPTPLLRAAVITPVGTTHDHARHEGSGKIPWIKTDGMDHDDLEGPVNTDAATLLAGFVFERDQRPPGWDEVGPGPCAPSVTGAPGDVTGGRWFGVGPNRCEDGRVVRVVFGGRERLQSVPFTLSPVVGDLTTLVRLQLDYTGLIGTIPREVGRLLNLQQLILSVTSISGTLPLEMGNLAKLERLQLAQTKLT